MGQSAAFALVDSARYIRIMRDGRLDLNGASNGPWTEFNVEGGGDGTLIAKAVKAERWLTVVSGEFAVAEDPELLLPVPVMGSASALEPDDTELLLPAEGEEITLRPMDGGPALPFPVRVSRKRKRVLILGAGEGNFACNPEGKFHRKGGSGQWAQWEVTATAEGGAALKNVGHNSFLALDAATGHARLAREPTVFKPGLGTSAPSLPELPIDPTVLSAEDIAHFKEKGYIVLRDAVPPEFVRDELRSINHQLGKPDCWVADGNPLNSGQLKLRIEDPVPDVPARSPRLWSALNVLLGSGNVTFRPRDQVALRFPLPPGRGHRVPDVKPGTVYHVDGMGLNRLFPFTVLCGVALSDQSKPDCGNLHVFPGSHLNEEVHRYYVESVADTSLGVNDPSKPDLGESVQVLLRPGDVVLAHQLMAHRVGINTSEHIRYQLYFRVHHKDHEKLKWQVRKNPWVEYAV